MTGFTLSAIELTAFFVGCVITALISTWIIYRRQQWSSLNQQRVLFELEQNQLRVREQLEQQLTHTRSDNQELSARLEQNLVTLTQLQKSFSDCEKELAAARQSVVRVEGLEQEIRQRDMDYKQLLSDFRSLEARTSAEKEGMEEKLALLRETREQLNNEFQLLANKIFEDKQVQFNQQSKEALSSTVEPLKSQIEAFRKKVEDAYDKENAERNRLVGQIAELQKQTRQIGEDAINLTNALKGDNKAQGNWGEVILERLLEESGLQRGREYEIQVALKDEDGRRRNPDVIIRLPEKKDIVIDSKVSLVHYEQYTSAENTAEKERFLKLHLSSLRTHIQQLSGKSYEKLESIRSLDFVFLFIPIEAAFMTALQADQSIFREAYEKHIILVSPTTLLASLRTVENIWRYEKQNRNAEEIARQAGGMHDQFVLVLESISEVGRQIGKAGEAFELVNKRLASGNGNLIRRVENLRKLGAKTKKQLPTELLIEDDAGLLESDAEEQL